ncbi:MAG: type I 3-dehydroquinate dehydratase, partial [Promethearchaeota archaeon]
MKKFPFAVALQVTGDKIDSGILDKEVQECQENNATYVEFRIDYEARNQDLDLPSLVSLGERFDLEPILTCRLKKEGGLYEPENKKQHLKIIEKMINARPRFVDIELSNNLGLKNSALDLAENKGVRLILSWHDFGRTPPLGKISQFVLKIKNEIQEIRIPEN